MRGLTEEEIERAYELETGNVIVEGSAARDFDTEALAPHCGPAPQYLLDKHYMRKHGPNAYYGQGGAH